MAKLTGHKYPKNLLCVLGCDLLDNPKGLDAALQTLTEREQMIIWMRYGESKTHQEIGEAFGITRERIRQIEERTIKKLKNQKELIEGERATIVRCKNCQFFETDAWARVNGIPLIVAHNICKKWGDGCKTNPDGYCFMGISK